MKKIAIFKFIASFGLVYFYFTNIQHLTVQHDVKFYAAWFALIIFTLFAFYNFYTIFKKSLKL